MTRGEVEMRKQWTEFLRKLSPEEKSQLTKAGFNLLDPSDDGMSQFHKTFAPNDEDDDPQRGFGRKYRTQIDMSDKYVPDKKDPPMDFAVAIAASIIDVFSSTTNQDVKMHADCVKLAIGYPSCGSQKDIAKRYGRSKAYISFRVRSIQKRLNLPNCIFNGNRTSR
jgi:hypothetical protein